MNNPTTLEECFLYLDEYVGKENKEYIRGTLNGTHFTIGMNIRNEWGLWNGGPLRDWFNNIGIYHADDMSGIILTSYQRYLRGEDIGLDERVKHYQQYWVNLGVNIKAEMEACDGP